jgi:hypothetical protein
MGVYATHPLLQPIRGATDDVIRTAYVMHIQWGKSTAFKLNSKNKKKAIRSIGFNFKTNK